MERDIYFVRLPENQLVPNDDSSSEDLPLRLEGLTGRAVASFFVRGVGGGGWGIIASAEGTSFVGGLWVSSPGRFSNLEALKHYFQHLS